MGLRAQVRTTDGWAVQHATVTLTDRTGAQMVRADADSDGLVASDVKLPPGPYTVIVTAVGYAPAAATAFVTSTGVADAGTVVLIRQGNVDLPPPGVWNLDPAHSSVVTIAQHLGISSVRGRFTEFGGRITVAAVPEHSRVDAVIDAATIDTGNGVRDKHLRSPDFLDAERYPEITYHSTGSTSPARTAGPYGANYRCTESYGRWRWTCRTSGPGPTRGAVSGRPSARRRSCCGATSP